MDANSPEPPLATLGGGRYLLGDRLGAGGMASVWMAFDDRLGTWRAAKLLHPELASRPKLRQRFENEARTLALLEHHNIVRVYDVGADQDVPWLAMELLQGGSPDDWVQAGRPLPARMAVEVILAACAALAVAHDRGVVHRDVKPSNILFGGDGTPKVTDFGIARASDGKRGLTRAGTAMGTLAFMAPEQQQDATSVDHRADIFAIGATLYNLATAKTSYKLTFADEEPRVLRELDPALRQVVTRACRASRDLRHPDIRAFAAELEALFPELPPVPAGLPPLFRPDGPPRARPTERPRSVATPVSTPADPTDPTAETLGNDRVAEPRSIVPPPAESSIPPATPPAAERRVLAAARPADSTSVPGSALRPAPPPSSPPLARASPAPAASQSSPSPQAPRASPPAPLRLTPSLAPASTTPAPVPQSSAPRSSSPALAPRSSAPAPAPRSSTPAPAGRSSPAPAPRSSAPASAPRSSTPAPSARSSTLPKTLSVEIPRKARLTVELACEPRQRIAETSASATVAIHQILEERPACMAAAAAARRSGTPPELTQIRLGGAEPVPFPALNARYERLERHAHLCYGCPARVEDRDWGCVVELPIPVPGPVEAQLVNRAQTGSSLGGRLLAETLDGDRIKGATGARMRQQGLLALSVAPSKLHSRWLFLNRYIGGDELIEAIFAPAGGSNHPLQSLGLLLGLGALVVDGVPPERLQHAHFAELAALKTADRRRELTRLATSPDDPPLLEAMLRALWTAWVLQVPLSVVV